MKKRIASILLILLIVSLCACTDTPDSSKDPLVFYYPWADLEAAMKQDPHCTALGYEERDISGNRENLRYLLTLYFQGPLDTDLASAFPKGTSALEVQMEDTALTVTLNHAFGQLEGMDLTLACTCLARTCFGLTDAQSVTIKTAPTDDTPELSVTITRDNFLLEDHIPEATSTE